MQKACFSDYLNYLTVKILDIFKKLFSDTDFNVEISDMSEKLRAHDNPTLQYLYKCGRLSACYVLEMTIVLLRQNLRH